MIDGRQKFFLRPDQFSKNVGCGPTKRISILVVVDMCCVLSRHVAGFLLIVGVGGRVPHECVLLVVGMENMLSKTTSHTNTMRKKKEEWGLLGQETQDGKGGRSKDPSPLNGCCVLTQRLALLSFLFPLCLVVEPHDYPTQNHLSIRALSLPTHSLSFYPSLLQNE